jgi:hypothetical protein
MNTGSPKRDDPAGSPGAVSTPASPPQRRSCTSAVRAALVVRREVWKLTWISKLCVLALGTIGFVLLARGLCAFLAITDPVGGQFLVVEGWMPTYVYREAAEQFSRGTYSKILAVGVTQDDTDPEGDLREDSGQGRLTKFGVPDDRMVTVSSDEVHRDRTFHSAMAVKRWLHEQGLQSTSIDVVTVGPHARRSRLLYEEALGGQIGVGVFSVQDRRFDPDHWWQSSQGVRTVVGEFLAYVYARLLFSPPS